ncbi:MAG: replication initiator protein [Microviridae sp.]|nr:MAG: replication initiator protein [Microviridae sp.]
MYVGCGRCNFCLQSRRMDWCFRIEWEQKVASSSKFITLTYADEYLPIDLQSGQGTLDKGDLQDFFKRMRHTNKKFEGKDRRPLRYYAVGEYGTDGKRPHYHIILFNAKRETIRRLAKTWPLGQTHVGRVTPASIGYTTGYVISSKQDYGTLASPFATMSRRPGLGNNYLKSNSKWHRPELSLGGVNRFFVQDKGNERRLPRYFKDRIFNSDEKKAYAIQAMKAVDKAYNDELTRLKRYNRDPEALYQEALRTKHNSISHKNKKLRSI